ncbi:hypothetical protein FZEAL_2573 [Fusarium zealandicum]|uniref:Uncharacterized protein n=1 Tax=Fusarium zealandicum TaxID=1053134 RepID=A0A8H4URA1_9HYPO|nr:hypothetical protein FZEAL_2573 [Fusarium zealandicum]
MEQLIPIGWNEAIPEEQGHVLRASCRSAYLWDKGLRTACSESRAVITKHSWIEEWEELFQRAYNERRHHRHYKPGWVGGEEAVAPGMVTIREGHQEWHPMVYPSRDIFWVTANNSGKWPDQLGDHCILLHVRPFVGNEWQTLEAQDMALEFDPSWNHAFPDVDNTTRNPSGPPSGYYRVRCGTGDFLTSRLEGR